MKMCVSERAREDRIERVISDETVMVISSPIMLRRKKKGKHPVLKGLINVQQYPVALYQDFLAIENLYGDADDISFDGDYEEWNRRHELRSKITRGTAYWWIFKSNRAVKEDELEYLFKTDSDISASQNLVAKFKNEYAPAKQWAILRYGQVIPILRKHRIINKLLDELIIVKLTD